MWKVTLKGIWAKKVRFLLTGVAVMLGVAFVSGTFVLTATISNTFDGLFNDIYQHTDAVVRAKEEFSGQGFGNEGRGHGRRRPAADGARRRRRGRGRRDGAGTGGHRRQEGRRARQQRARARRRSASAYIPDRDLSTIHVVEGRGPRGPDEIVIDKRSADDAGYKVGATVPVVTKAGRNDYTLTGIVKFGSTEQPARRDHRRVHAGHRDARARHARSVPGDRREGRLRASRRTRSSATSAPRSSPNPAPRTIEVISGKDITAESQSNLKDNLSFFNTFLLIFGVVALLVGSFIIFNTFSIVVAQRSRELALLRAIGAGQRQVLGSVLFEAVLVGLVASIVGFVAGIGLAVGLKALLGALGLDIPASSIVIPATAFIWSFVLGMIVTVVAAIAPALRAARASRRSPPCATRPSTTRARRRAAAVFGIVITLIGLAFLLLGLFGNSGLLYVGLGMGVVFLGVAVLGPMIAAPISGALGIPIQKFKGVTGVDRARERDAQPEAHVGHRRRAHDRRRRSSGSSPCSAASARTSVNAAHRPVDEGRLRHHVTRVRAGLDPARGAAARWRRCPRSRRRRASAAARPRSTARSTQVIAADPAKIDSLFDLEPKEGKISELSANGIAVLDSTSPATTAGSSGQKVPITFAQTGTQQFTVESIYKQIGLHELRDHHRRVREELHRPVRLPGVREHEGWRHAREHRRGQEGDAPVPGAEGADPRRVQGLAGRADQPVPQPGLRAAVLRHRHRAVRHRQHARACRSSNAVTSSACCARWA